MGEQRSPIFLCSVWLVGLVVWLTNGLTAQEPAAWRLVTPEGHTSGIHSAAFSPDGRYVATASDDHTARIWEVLSGRELQRFTGHTDAVESVAFSPDGRHVATASDDYTVRIWEVVSGREVQRFTGHTSYVESTAFSPDGRSVATASLDHTVRIWEVASGREVQRYTGHTGYVWSAAFSPDGSSVVTAGDDNTARVWEVASGREVRRFTGHTDRVFSAAFSPDGHQVVTAASDSTARVWEVASGREVRRFTGHTERVFSAAFSPRVFSAAFSPDGRYVATASDDYTARIWEVASGREVRRFTGHTDAVRSAAFSPDGRSVVTAGFDGTARVWEVASGRELQRFAGHTEPAVSTAFSPDGRSVVTAGWGGTARVWEVASGRELRRFTGHTNEVNSAAFSLDGSSLVTASRDGTARVWEVASGQEVQRFTGHTDEVNAAALSPDGRHVVTAASDSTARVWEVASGRELQRFTGHTGYVVSAAFSPDGRSVVTAGWDGTARVWEAASGREVQRFTVQTDVGRSARLVSAAFSPDGRSVVTTGEDNSARVWEVASGRELQRFTGHTGYVGSAAFSPDGRYLVTAGEDGTTRLWDPRTGAELFRRIVVDSNDWVAVAPDGRFDGTEVGMRWMHYTNGLQTIGLDAFFERFYTPGLIGLLLARTPYTGPDIRKGFGRAPSVRVLSPHFGDTVQVTTTVAIAVKDEGGGAEDVRLYHNGALVAGTARSGIGVKREGCPASTVCFQVDLLPGANTLEATAFSAARLEAERARISVTVPGTRPTATLHLIVVGINTYQNPRYSLNYGRADGKAFVDSLLAGGEGIFAQMAIDTLYDTAATGLAIKAAFRRVAASAKPQDVFVFFYAGHGIAEQVGDSTHFYLVSSDVTQMSDPEQLGQRAVSNLQQLFDAVPARKKLMLIDACQSGQALVAFAQRGAAEEQAIARLARASGVFVMSSAGSDQQASEVGTLGHGVFTYAWLQAMARGAAGPRERLVGALASEVERVIPELSRQFRARPQYPIVFRNGQDFPLIVR